MSDVLSALGTVSATDLGRLHDRLVERAGHAGVLDVAYHVVKTPIGPLLLAASPQGLVRVAFGREDHDAVLGQLAYKVSSRILHAPKRVEEAAGQLDEYFEGKRLSFELPLDLRLSSGFRRQVLDHLRVIAYGRTESYGEVARATGRPRAARAVGTACATNPLPIVVPCHRVVHSDGSPGGYGGGLDVKYTLLALEGVLKGPGIERSHVEQLRLGE
ncbi:MAG: methylated-DNA--[protein]-cysteine S-methyltransferase [Chloroflexota bacterium]